MVSDEISFSGEVKKYIRDIPDFPKPGINFKDITPLLRNSEIMGRVVDYFSDRYLRKGIDVVLAAEARGFIFGSLLAMNLGAGFVPLRKSGKLPYKTIRQEYELEYGRAVFEIHEDAIKKGEKVLIFDDVIATGGTAQAAVRLVEKLGGIVAGIAFLIELSELKGREKLKGYDITSLIKY